LKTIVDRIKTRFQHHPAQDYIDRDNINQGHSGQEHFDQDSERPIRVLNRRLLCPDPQFSKHVKSKLAIIERVCLDWYPGQRSKIPQGFTYLAQLLVHEITSREGVSQRSRALDLDSIYGNGALIDQAGRFVYCRPTIDTVDDLFRHPHSKKAVIAEVRNDENMIIAQIYLLLLKFHNKVMDCLEEEPRYKKSGMLCRFKKAKYFVTAIFQKIIFEDLLPRLTHKAVYQHFRRGGEPFIDIADSETELPLEMTHASLRFGHSMVRDTYVLNGDHGKFKIVDLAELFRLTEEHSGPAYTGIPKSHRIDWDFFFETIDDKNSHDIGPEMASQLNPHIVKSMTDIGPRHLNIIRLNVMAGVNKNLPSGQALARSLLKRGAGDLQLKDKLELHTKSNERLKIILEKNKLWENTPLFLFMLIEAEGPGSAGSGLGPLGSILLCEAVRNALEFDSQKHYQERLREFNSIHCLSNIQSMADLVNFTKARL